MLFSSRTRPTPHEVAEFENALGFQLPVPYRTFLLEVNGGTPVASELRTTDGVFHFEALESLLPNRHTGLWHAAMLMRTWLPGQFLPIGHEGTGGGEFLLHAGTGAVSYCSNDSGNTDPLAGSFDEFWDRLEAELPEDGPGLP